jgi:hypothetical protein
MVDFVDLVESLISKNNFADADLFIKCFWQGTHRFYSLNGLYYGLMEHALYKNNMKMLDYLIDFILREDKKRFLSGEFRRYITIMAHSNNISKIKSIISSIIKYKHYYIDLYRYQTNSFETIYTDVIYRTTHDCYFVALYFAQCGYIMTYNYTDDNNMKVNYMRSRVLI